MPPKARITRDMIIDAAFDVMNADGISIVNVWRIAKRLYYSTQSILPIFWLFSNEQYERGNSHEKWKQSLDHKSILSKWRMDSPQTHRFWRGHFAGFWAIKPIAGGGINRNHHGRPGYSNCPVTQSLADLEHPQIRNHSGEHPLWLYGCFTWQCEAGRWLWT